MCQPLMHTMSLQGRDVSAGVQTATETVPKRAAVAHGGRDHVGVRRTRGIRAQDGLSERRQDVQGAGRVGGVS